MQEQNPEWLHKPLASNLPLTTHESGSLELWAQVFWSSWPRWFEYRLKREWWLSGSYLRSRSSGRAGRAGAAAATCPYWKLDRRCSACEEEKAGKLPAHSYFPKARLLLQKQGRILLREPAMRPVRSKRLLQLMWLNCDTFLITSRRDWSHKSQSSSSQRDPAGQLRCMVADPGAWPTNPGKGNTGSAGNRLVNATE